MITKDKLNKFLLDNNVRLITPYKDIQIDVDYLEINEGWFELIYELMNKLILVGWDKKVTQIKEKFGELRFYVENGTDEIFNIIHEYENKSYYICELCGSNGLLRNNSWKQTLCNNCCNKRT